MSMQGDPAAGMGAATSEEIDELMDGGADRTDRERPGDPSTVGEGDPEALGDEREEYPDPDSYPPPEVTDGATPDADLRTDAG